MIRRCPHCDLIWIKVQGCDGLTNCGSRAWSGDAFVDSSEGSSSTIQKKKKYWFEFLGETVKWIEQKATEV